MIINYIVSGLGGSVSQAVYLQLYSGVEEKCQLSRSSHAGSFCIRFMIKLLAACNGSDESLKVKCIMTLVDDDSWFMSEGRKPRHGQRERMMMLMICIKLTCL